MSESFLYFCSIGFVIDVSYDFILSCSRKKKSRDTDEPVNLESAIEELGSRNISIIFKIPDHEDENHHKDEIQSKEPEAHVLNQKEQPANPDEKRPCVGSIDFH